MRDNNHGEARMATYNPHFNLWILGSDEKDFIIPKIVPIDHPGRGAWQ
jgi:hypothetical protein